MGSCILVGYATNYKVLFTEVNSPTTKKGEKNMGSVSDIPYENRNGIQLFYNLKHHHVIQKKHFEIGNFS